MIDDSRRKDLENKRMLTSRKVLEKIKLRVSYKNVTWKISGQSFSVLIFSADLFVFN